MKREQIIKKISEIPAGRFFRMRYISKVRISSSFEKDGISIFKVVDTTTRTGVKYKNIAKVKETSYTYPEEYEPKKTNWEWVVKDRIKHNTKTGKDYVVVALIGKGANTEVTYIYSDKNGSKIIDKAEVEKFAVASYFKTEAPTIMNITLENILLVY